MIETLKMLKATQGTKTLICFPFAGGYSPSYRPLSQAIESNWDIFAVEPPGHGTNISPLINNIIKQVELYEEILLERFSNQSFALFGHSMGGIIVYELTQRLEKRGVYPEVIFISGIVPPHYKKRKVSHLNDDELLEYIESLGGLSQEILQEKELLEYFLPIFRNDFFAVESHVYDCSRIIETPTHIFSGENDPFATPKIMKEWEKYLKKTTFHVFDGGHMFPLTNATGVGSILNKCLM